MNEALRMDDEAGVDRWSIGDLRRDRLPLARVDRLLPGPELPTAVRAEIEKWLERVERRVDDLERRLLRLPEPPPERASGYTLFYLGSRGYEAVDCEGIAPDAGAPVVIGNKRFVVERTRRSPFPADPRPCLVLSPPSAQAAGSSPTTQV